MIPPLRNITAVGAALLVLALPFPELNAQTTRDCTYDQCALRVQSRLFSRSIVRGRDAERVARIGMFVHDLPLFREGPDSAARYYAAFRSAHNRGTLLSLLATALFVVASATRGPYDWEAPSFGLFVTGVAVGIGGSINVIRSEDRLSKAVWWYNRALLPAP